MPQDEEATEAAHERTALLGTCVASLRGDEAHSIVASAVSKEEQALGGTAIGKRLPYNDYTTIDWLHDLVGAETCGMRQHD
jgi:chloride channel 3/4/5